MFIFNQFNSVYHIRPKVTRKRLILTRYQCGACICMTLYQRHGDLDVVKNWFLKTRLNCPVAVIVASVAGVGMAYLVPLMGSAVPVRTKPH